MNRALDGRLMAAGQVPVRATTGAPHPADELLPDEIKREFQSWLRAFQDGDLERWRGGSVRSLEHVFEFSIQILVAANNATPRQQRERRPRGSRLEEFRIDQKAYTFVAADTPTWEAIFHVIQRSSRWPAAVGRETYDGNFVIVGPPGAGKTSFARLVHALMGRTGPFVNLETGGLVETMLLADLFGVAQGYATGSLEREGVIEAARTAGRATLFIDEFLDLPALQGALLRLLEDRQYRKLGEVGSRTARDLLIILATNLAETPESLRRLTRPPSELVRPGAADVGGFQGVRADLYGRFGPVLELKPLIERPQALKRLVVDRLRFRGARGVLEESVLKELGERPWVGNIRELLRFVDDVADFQPDGDLPVRVPRGMPATLVETDIERAAATTVTEAVVQGIEPWRSLMQPRGDPEVRGVVVDEFVRRKFAQMAEPTREAAYEVFQRFAIEWGFESRDLLNKSLPRGRRMRAVATKYLTRRRSGMVSEGGADPGGEDD